MSGDLLEHELFGTNEPADPDRWVFHYTSLAAAKSMATTKTFRLGRMVAMNDPREYKATEAVTVRAGLGYRLEPAEIREAIQTLVDRRLGIAVGSFTADSAAGGGGTATRAAARGYARPSLWAHYASRHQGVCLVLEKTALSNQLHTTFPGDGIADLVAYVTGIDPHDWSGILDLDEVASLGIPAAIDKHVRRHVDHLVFTKHDDWSVEREWRCCVLTQPPGVAIDLSLERGAVAGVVAGLDLPEGDLGELQYLSDRFGIQSNIARTYIHQLNMIDVVPIDTSTSSSWRYFTRPELQTLGYL